jgi:hypothetical protein
VIRNERTLRGFAWKWKVQEGARHELRQARGHHEVVAEKCLERLHVAENTQNVFLNTLWSDELILPDYVQSNFGLFSDLYTLLGTIRSSLHHQKSRCIPLGVHRSSIWFFGGQRMFVWL